MATLNHIFDLHQPQQICYVQCDYCTTILLVSVPNSSLSMLVTVRCGHCNSLLSVNMMKASFVPLHVFPPINLSQDQEEPKQIVFHEKDDAEDEPKNQISNSQSLHMYESDEEEKSDQPVYQFTNKRIHFQYSQFPTPEKRQRAPSAYNQFIKEEIKRLKVRYPDMTHKQAFSTAAKNWAHHFPLAQEMGGEEDIEQGMSKIPRRPNMEEVHFEGNGFSEGKYSNHVIK